MSSANDVSALFRRFGGDASSYHEVVAEQQVDAAVSRWPILNEINPLIRRVAGSGAVAPATGAATRVHHPVAEPQGAMAAVVASPPQGAVPPPQAAVAQPPAAAAPATPWAGAVGAAPAAAAAPQAAWSPGPARGGWSGGNTPAAATQPPQAAAPNPWAAAQPPAAGPLAGMAAARPGVAESAAGGQTELKALFGRMVPRKPLPAASRAATGKGAVQDKW